MERWNTDQIVSKFQAVVQKAPAILQSSAWEHLRPSVHLQPATSLDNSTATLGQSKLGGSPGMPSAQPWPFWHGRPLSFIGQINLSETSPAQIPETRYTTTVLKYECFHPRPALPESGILYFFYDTKEHPGGFSTESQGGCRVIYYAGDRTLLQMAVAPEGTKIFNPFSLEAEVELTTPPFESHYYINPNDRYLRSLRNARLIKEVDLTRAEVKKWGTMQRGLDKLFDEVDPRRHRLLGHPDTIGTDVPDMQWICQMVNSGMNIGGMDKELGLDLNREKALRDKIMDWRLLLQVDSDERLGMCWGNGGRIYFWIREQDLSDQNFNYPWVVLQS